MKIKLCFFGSCPRLKTLFRLADGNTAASAGREAVFRNFWVSRQQFFGKSRRDKQQVPNI